MDSIGSFRLGVIGTFDAREISNPPLQLAAQAIITRTHVSYLWYKTGPL
jgi:hypothetical protein